MDKRYQVFVSSTFKDLQEERQKVISILIAMDCFPAAMEYFSASDEDQWSLIKRVIDQCDYYVLIVGGMYGSIDPKSGLSYTEIEYDYAIEKGKPTIAFVHENPSKLPADKCEPKDEGKAKLEAFRNKVSQKIWRAWSTSDGLAAAVSVGMMKLKELRPSAGWMKASEGIDPEKMVALRNRVDELEVLVDALQNTPPESASDLAQGEEQFEIWYAFVMNAIAANASALMTWDEIFTAVGQPLLNPTAEQELSDHLAGWILQRFRPGAHSGWLIRGAFQHIVIQLLALGLIEQAPGERMWKLAAYGKSYLMRLGAIRSQKAAVP